MGLPGGTPVGMTGCWDLGPENRRLEIAATWPAASAQLTLVSPEVELLQLTRAFDGFDRSGFRAADSELH